MGNPTMRGVMMSPYWKYVGIVLNTALFCNKRGNLRYILSFNTGLDEEGKELDLETPFLRAQMTDLKTGREIRLKVDRALAFLRLVSPENEKVFAK